MAEYNFNSTFNPFANTQTQGSPLFNSGYNNSGVQLSALQRAMGNGGLNLNYAGTGWNTTSKPYSYGSYQQGVQSGGLRQGYSPADQRAADILNQAGPGPQTPLPKGGGYPGSQPSGGFLNWLNSLFSGGGSNTAAVGNATSTPGVTDNSADIIYPSFMAPPPKGSALNPAGSGDDENRPAPITSMTPSGSVGTTTITGVAGDRANTIQDSGTNQSDADLLKQFQDYSQKQRDAQLAALQANADRNEHDQTISDRQRDDARNQYMAAQQALGQPSADEIQGQADIDNLEGSKGQTLAGLANQPIATGFITGQQAAVEKRVLAQEQPLQTKLSRLQAIRQARTAAALDSTKTMYQSADEASKALGEKRNKLTDQMDSIRNEGNKSDTETYGKYLDYERAQNAKKNDPYTLSPGSVRYQNGQQVASAPPKPTAPKAPKAGSSYTPTQVNTLIGGGFQRSVIPKVYEAVNQHGLDYVLNNSDLTDAQKTSLTSIYRKGTSGLQYGK